MTHYPIDTGSKPEVTHFFDPATNTFSYVVKDPDSPACKAMVEFFESC